MTNTELSAWYLLSVCQLMQLCNKCITVSVTLYLPAYNLYVSYEWGITVEELGDRIQLPLVDEQLDDL